MKNTYQPILLDKITDEVVIEILRSVLPVFKELGIEYFVVGAFARDIGLLAKGFDEAPARITGDIDLAVMLSNKEEYEKLKVKLTFSDDFKLHPNEPIKLIYKEKYELDLLPFGDIEEDGMVKLKSKRSFTLDMPGFAEVFQDVRSIRTDQDFDLNICSLPGVVLLKLLAWDDRNHRKKDIQDIEYIIRNLYLLEIEEIVSTDGDLLELLNNENNFSEAVTARYIGRKIGQLLNHSEKILSRINQILIDNIHDSGLSKIGRIMSFETLEDSVNIIHQLYLGIQDSTT